MQAIRPPEPAEVATSAKLIAPSLRGGDADLQMLAARAAMELEVLRLTGRSEFDAVKVLGSRLRNSFAESTGSAARRMLLDSSAVSLVGHALNSATVSGRVSTLDELNAKAWQFAGKIEEIEKSPRPELAESIRNFCVALSEAASYQEALYDSESSHPNRR